MRINKDIKDTGFGSSTSGQQGRLINQDGSFNVKRSGIPFLDQLSVYHVMLNVSWVKFNIMVALCYLSINTFFAILYYLVGIQHLGGIMGDTPIEKFEDAFFFSAQTLTTVGYGRISPIGFWASSIAAIEAMVGLLGFALATGILYGRFSKPRANIMFSDHILYAPYHGINSIQFRIANARDHQLIEVEVQLMLTRVEVDDMGVKTRKFYTLPLERKMITFLALSWTIVHPIDENSPLYGWTQENIESSDPEFIVVIKAFDDTFSQTVHTRSSYKFYQLAWGAKFVPMYEYKDKHTVLELDKIDEFYEITPNENELSKLLSNDSKSIAQ